ncbi:MAG TPA: DUF1304 domain-containing protein [Candidatus Sulfotelmatobacter sp.]|nr:DUF1304 domain-containing protein [Candidatus Sulfotelmatobacter sp.]
MPLVAVAATLVAAAIHVWFFVLESVLFTRPTVWARFGLRSADAAETVRPMAFNQGFYNLYLAAGAAGGLLLVAAGDQAAGRGMALFACACMAGAGAVLGATNRRLAGAALVQAGPPLIALVAAFTL